MRLRPFQALRLTLIAVLMLFSAFTITLQPTHAQTALDVINIQRATVQIMQMYTNPLGQPVVSCVGSGTLISADGLIVTNAHIARASTTCRSDRIAIALTQQIDAPPSVAYYADEVGENVGWDLAILQVTSTLDHRPVDRTSLSLPFVDIGDSDGVQLDQTIEVVGYSTPAHGTTINGASTVLRGTVNGITAELGVGARAWIKTRLAIPGGMSGGGAYDTDGKLIGIPTIEPTRSDGVNIDCRRVQDTNGDGVVNEKDGCIPISGLINAIRPVRLVRGLILAAKLGIAPKTQTSPQTPSSPSTTSANQQAIFSRLFFAPGINAAGMPTSVVTGMPAGTASLYLFFDYTNMIDGLIYELRVTRDGISDAAFSLAPSTWSGGQNGMWYIGSTAQVWPNGTYDFSLFINGARAGDLADKKITIGGPPKAIPTIKDILFGTLDADNQLVGAGNVLPVGNIIYAQFVYNNMTNGLPVRQVWYSDNVKILDNPPELWKYAANGTKQINAKGSDKQPLQPGRYRLELWIGDQMAATSDFIMSGAEQASFQTEMFNNLNFSTQLPGNLAANKASVGTTFANTITSLYATFDWRDVAPDTPWTWRWTVDNNPLFEVSQPWIGAATGSTFWLRLDARGTIPDGSYTVELILGGIVRASATAKVGLGQLPLTTFSSAAGVQVQGQIIDAETRAGIPGVAFIVLKPEFAVADFTWDMSQVYDMTQTDSQGQFTLSKLVPRTQKGQLYSILVVAQGYLTLTTDGVSIDLRTKTPLVFKLELNRD